MRWSIILILALGCGDDTNTMPDAGLDAEQPDAAMTCPGITFEQSHNAPIGACCAEAVSPLCGGNMSGICVIDRCVLQCSGHQPACPITADNPDGVPTWRTGLDGQRQCICP